MGISVTPLGKVKSCAPDSTRGVESAVHDHDDVAALVGELLTSRFSCRTSAAALADDLWCYPPSMMDQHLELQFE
jgi:hypothetical protein